jgi:hypothetical protein
LIITLPILNFDQKEAEMEIDAEKIDDTVLALLYLTSFPDHGVT